MWKRRKYIYWKKYLYINICVWNEINNEKNDYCGWLLLQYSVILWYFNDDMICILYFLNYCYRKYSQKKMTIIEMCEMKEREKWSKLNYSIMWPSNEEMICEMSALREMWHFYCPTILCDCQWW